MNNVTGNMKIRTRLNDSDRKVLNLCGNDYLENSAVFPQVERLNPLLNNRISNIHNNNHPKSILSDYTKNSDFYL